MLETIKFWGEVGIGGVFAVLFLAWVVWPRYKAWRGAAMHPVVAAGGDKAQAWAAQAVASGLVFSLKKLVGYWGSKEAKDALVVVGADIYAWDDAPAPVAPIVVAPLSAAPGMYTYSVSGIPEGYELVPKSEAAK